MTPKKEPKLRLDELLVKRKLAADLLLAEGLIMAADVTVDGKVITKAGFPVTEGADIKLQEHARFVSRAGDKLEAALQQFHLQVSGQVCADIGASTGGFTDCLLQHGAKEVFAVDVGHGLLHPSLERNARVIIMDRTNARFLETFSTAPKLITIDCSFISLRSILPQASKWLTNGGEVIALIKPQFEASQKDVSRGRGVIHDPKVRQDILEDILTYAHECGFSVRGLIQSPITGKKGGNVEYLAHLSYPASENIDIPSLISHVFK